MGFTLDIQLLLFSKVTNLPLTLDNALHITAVRHTVFVYVQLILIDV